MLLFQIFLHKEVKRNQNKTKRPLFGDPYRNSTCQLTLSLRKKQIRVFRYYFSVRHFLASSSYFWTSRLNSLSSLPVVHFLKQCIILFKERSSDRPFNFLTGLAPQRGAASAIHSIIYGDFYWSGCSHPFFQGLYRTKILAAVTYEDVN